MEVGESTAPRAGLRERKKQETREKIIRAAMQLFAERGYDRTTLAEVADAAGISPRTIFAYFESKEDIVFCDDPHFFEQLRQALEERPPDATTVDALRGFLANIGEADEIARMRKQVIAQNEELKLSARARTGPLEQLVSDSIARDLRAGPDDLRPAIIAASITAAFTSLADRAEAQSGEPLTHEQMVAMFDDVLEFVRGGIEGLQQP
jgi:AcrR family transcriptional regulator